MGISDSKSQYTDEPISVQGNTLNRIIVVSRTRREVMRVFALGGSGKVGLPAIQLLAQSDVVTEHAAKTQGHSSPPLNDNCILRTGA